MSEDIGSEHQANIQDVMEVERADDRDRVSREDDQRKTQMVSLDADLARDADRRDGDEEKKPKTRYPDQFEDRYFIKEGNGETTVYADSKGDRELFRDSGDRMRAKDASELAVKAMVETAQHREWQRMDVRGSREFKREVWLEGQARGIQVKGYKPNDLDRQELKNRGQQFLKNDLSRGDEGDLKEDAITHEREESGMPERAVNEQTNRHLVEATIERGLNRQFPKDPDKVAVAMRLAREHLDSRKAQGEKLPDLKVRETREVELSKEQRPQKITVSAIRENMKRQEQDKDIEKAR